MKKFIRLINNERTNLKITSQKAEVVCESGATDICNYIDQSACAAYAYDKCASFDLAACIQGAHDYCESNYDTKACYGPGNIDE